MGLWGSVKRAFLLTAAKVLAWTGGSVADHLLGSYLRSLLAVLLVQFTRKGFPAGMQGALHLVERSPPIQVRLKQPDPFAACWQTVASMQDHPFDVKGPVTLLPMFWEVSKRACCWLRSKRFHLVEVASSSYMSDMTRKIPYSAGFL